MLQITVEICRLSLPQDEAGKDDPKACCEVARIEGIPWQVAARKP